MKAKDHPAQPYITDIQDMLDLRHSHSRIAKAITGKINSPVYSMNRTSMQNFIRTRGLKVTNKAGYTNELPKKGVQLGFDSMMEIERPNREMHWIHGAWV